MTKKEYAKKKANKKEASHFEGKHFCDCCTKNMRKWLGKRKFGLKDSNDNQP